MPTVIGAIVIWGQILASVHKNQSAPRRILCLNTHPASIRSLLPGSQWQLIFVDSLVQARKAIADPSIKVLLARISSPPEQGLAIAEDILFERKDLKAVALVDSEMLNNSCIQQAVGSRFFDYLTYPLIPDVVRYSVGHAHGMAMLACGCVTEDCFEGDDTYKLVGESAVMRTLLGQISRISSSDAPVMIGGESGTGKELAARNIHDQSSRRGAAFVAVNMAAIPENLVQTELFGHEKGAFTGAEKRRIGFIESANGGTLFLDEIGDLPLQSQGNLLRFLQEAVITRVGGSEVMSVDVRVVAATHVDLDLAVKQGRFREDLYYRLNVLELKMPALRERKGDIERLAKRFFQQFCDHSRCHAKGMSQQALQVIGEYDWPGNVREMVNRIQRAVVMCTDQLIGPEDLGLERRQSSRRIETLSAARGKAEKKLIQSTLIDAKNNLSEAARMLEISRVTLYKLIDKYSLGYLLGDSEEAALQTSKPGASHSNESALVR